MEKSVETSLLKIVADFVEKYSDFFESTEFTEHFIPLLDLFNKQVRKDMNKQEQIVADTFFTLISSRFIKSVQEVLLTSKLEKMIKTDAPHEILKHPTFIKAFKRLENLSENLINNEPLRAANARLISNIIVKYGIPISVIADFMDGRDIQKEIPSEVLLNIDTDYLHDSDAEKVINDLQGNN